MIKKSNKDFNIIIMILIGIETILMLIELAIIKNDIGNIQKELNHYRNQIDVSEPDVILEI